MPVIEHYQEQGKVAEVRQKFPRYPFSNIHPVCQIDSSPEVDEVHKATVTAVEKVLV